MPPTRPDGVEPDQPEKNSIGDQKNDWDKKRRLVSENRRKDARHRGRQCDESGQRHTSLVRFPILYSREPKANETREHTDLRQWNDRQHRPKSSVDRGQISGDRDDS
jgi:hypothetical protein